MAKEKPEVQRIREIVEKPKEAEEKKEEIIPKKIEEVEKIKIAEEEVLIPKAPPSRPPLVTKSETLVEIESILEKDLEEVYLSLDEEKRKEFKRKQEETANKIEEILKKVKVKIKEVFDLIIKWLKSIPGVNKFFLEQEAKIKTDRIIGLAERKGKEIK